MNLPTYPPSTTTGTPSRWLPAEAEQQAQQNCISRLKPPDRRKDAEDHEAECDTSEQHEHAHGDEEPGQE
jgi:hypothetical protein